MCVLADDVSSHIDNSHAATTQATAQLRKAAKTQRSNSSLVRTKKTLLIFQLCDFVVFATKAKFDIFYIVADMPTYSHFWDCATHCHHRCLGLTINYQTPSFNLQTSSEDLSMKLYKDHYRNISIVQILYTPLFPIQSN